jgi:glycosyltransferase involved in cell wall biosynthesis
MRYEARRFGKEILGPIIVDFLERLDQTSHFFSTNRGASILYVARAGVRIRKLHELYLARRRRELSPRSNTFFISRFLLTKGLWKRAPDAFFEMIRKEFEWQNVGQIVSALLDRAPEELASLQLDAAETQIPQSGFRKWLEQDSPGSQALRRYLNEQAELLSKYIDNLTYGSDCVLLVDSGWQGTCQRLLDLGWGDRIEWWGAYFGKSFFRDSDRAHDWRMIGLSFEADQFDPFAPSSAITAHRHIIEHLFEPIGRSVEQLYETAKGIIADTADTLQSEAPTEDDSPFYLGVQDYISTVEADISRSRIVERANIAARKLAGTIFFPDRSEALMLGTYDRSADFGKNINVPILQVGEGAQSGTAEDRIALSLWRAGQIACEYSGDIARARQQQEVSLKLTRKQLEYLGSPGAKAGVNTVKNGGGSVAIIMRTMDRRAFLRRALESVAGQSFLNYQLIVVCDGGDIDAAESEIKSSSLDPRKVTLIDNLVNRGMEASSNIGISMSESEYIIIHDDDDTWERDFLSKSVNYLERRGEYGGVITHSWHVSEEVTSEGIVTRAKFPYNDWVQNVQIMEMACGNFFPPIGFLFRRTICSNLGGFDAKFPVLGDWDFNIRFLEVADIGVISEKLANYHHRDVGNKHMFSNSVVGEISKHAEFNSLLRNKILRSSGNSSTGVLVGLGHVLDDLRREVRSVKREAKSGSESTDVRGEREIALTEFSDLIWVTSCIRDVNRIQDGAGVSEDRSRLEAVLHDFDMFWVSVHAQPNKTLKFPQSWDLN